MYKKVTHFNLKIFKKQANVNLSFKLGKRERNTPYTVIPEKIYNDFDRKNYKRHTITFPIHLPMKYRIVPTPKDVLRYQRIKPIRINYADKTGNELLLSLREHKSLTKEENLEIIYQLSRKSGVKNLDLENHPFVLPVIEEFIKKLPSWKLVDMVKLMNSANDLDFTDSDFWQKMKKTMLERIYAFEKITTTYFGQFFLVMMERVEFDEEEKELMLDQLGRHNREMHPDLVIKTFDYLIENGYLTSSTDHLYERHYFQHFWKFPKKFNLKQFASIIRGIKKINAVKDDLEFFEYEFLPYIKEKLPLCNDPEVLSNLLVELSDLENFGLPQGMKDVYENMIIEKLNFLDQTLDAVQNTSFVEMVKKDIETYKNLKLKGEI